jgi:hypothetical protein
VSLLLLFLGRPGYLATLPQTLALEAPAPAVFGVGTVTTPADAQTLGYGVPGATARMTVPAGGAVGFGFTPGAAALHVTGRAVLAAAPCTLAFTAGFPGITFDPTVPIISIGGVFRSDVLRTSLAITDVIDEQPNTCTFTIDGGPKPILGQRVIVAVGSQLNVEFGGHLTRIDQVYAGKPSNIRWECEAVDYTRLLDRRVVRASYPAQSVTATLIDLIQRFVDTSFFTYGHVAFGLPGIDAIDFTWEPVSRAITRLAKLCGAYWYVDYTGSIHFFQSEESDAPTDITDVTLDVRDLANGGDLSQVRTRVSVEGYGSVAAADVGPGGTRIPVEDAVFYDAAGGLVKTGTQRLTYATKIDGGQGTTVRGLEGPGVGSAPIPSVAGPGGGVLGTVYYAVSYLTAVGETLVGPYSIPVTGDPFPEPAGGFLTIVPAGPGPLAGDYSYRVTFVTADGETTAGTSAATFFRAVGAAAPAVGPGVESFSFLAPVLGPLVGQYQYVLTYVTALGETTAGPTTARTATAIARPPNSPVLTPTSVVGNLRPGSYTYGYSYLTALGETVPGPTTAITVTTWTPPAPSVNSWNQAAPGVGNGNYEWAVQWIDAAGGTSFLSGPSARLTVNNGPLTIFINIPAGPAGTVARRVFRRRTDDPNFNTFRVLGDQGDNTAPYFTDNVTVPGTQFNAGGTMGAAVTISVTGAPAGGGRIRVYRSKVGTAAPLYAVAELAAPAGSGTQSLVDNQPDSALSVLAPTGSTAGGEAFKVTIYTGPSGTLARRVYRTKRDGFQYYLLGEAPGNGANAILTDTTPDDSLTGTGPPYVNTGGGVKAEIRNLYSGPPGTLARRIYRTRAFGAGNAYFRAGELPDNQTTVFVDDKADTELGAVLPGANSAGASVILLSNLPIGPPAVTGRRIYRTMAGGGVLFFAQEVRDNVTTAITDDRSDKELGDPAPTVSGIGALPGDTTLRVVFTWPFYPAGGWAWLGNQLIAFSGVDAAASMLVGIPASGEGAIVAAVRAGDAVIAAPMLEGVGGVVALIRQGDAINILVERDDPAAQAVLAAVEGGDGVHEYFVQDNRLSIASAANRAAAELALFATAEQSLSFASRDPKLRSGKTIRVNLGPPTNIVGTFKIQQVVLQGFDVPGRLAWRQVTASNYLYSLEHLLRRVALGE